MTRQISQKTPKLNRINRSGDVKKPFIYLTAGSLQYFIYLKFAFQVYSMYHLISIRELLHRLTTARSYLKFPYPEIGDGNFNITHSHFID